MQDDQDFDVDPAAFIAIAREALARRTAVLSRDAPMAATTASYYGIVADAAIASLLTMSFGAKHLSSTSLVGHFSYKTERAGGTPTSYADPIGHIRVKEDGSRYRSVPIGVHRVRGEVVALITQVLVNEGKPVWCGPPRTYRETYTAVGELSPFALLKRLGALVGGDANILPIAGDTLMQGATEELKELLQHYNLLGSQTRGSN